MYLLNYKEPTYIINYNLSSKVLHHFKRQEYLVRLIHLRCVFSSESIFK